MTMMVKYCLFVLALISVTNFNCKFGKAEDDYPDVKGATADPAQAVAKALSCFGNNYIYNSCEESYRLTESGTLDVPPEHADQYCNGPCHSETHLVLDCIGNIFSHFEFSNKATTQDVRETIAAGCGSGSQRGNFDVAQHLEAEESNANKMIIPVFLATMMVLWGNWLLF